MVFAAVLCAERPYMVEGRVVANRATNDLALSVSSSSSRRPTDSVPIGPDGSFRIQVPGSESVMEFRVLNHHGEVLHATHMSTTRGVPVELRLPNRSAGSAVGKPGGISLRRLAFTPTRHLRRDFDAAIRQQAAGKYAEAAEAFELVTNTEPEWFEAWMNLGVCKASIGQFEPAIAAFSSAIEIDPNVVDVHSALGLALIRLKRYAEAERYARQARKLDPGSHRAAYALALRLAAEPARSTEALPLLEEVLPHYPDANLPLAAIRFDRGEFELSRDAASRFLHMSHSSNTQFAEKLLLESQLRLAR